MAKPTEVPGLTERTPLSVAGPLLVRARLSDLRRYEDAFEGATEPDADAVHDMRVAARRLRAAMALFGERSLASLEPEVKALQDALGTLRDLQVQRAWLRASQRTKAGRRADLGASLDRARPRAEKEVRRAVRAWRAAVSEQIDEVASATVSRGRLGGRLVARRVEAYLKRLDARLERARRKPSPRRLHQLRIATKKLRYAVELVRPAFHDGAPAVLAALVPLQEELGAVHDTHVRTETLERLVEEGTAPERRAASALLARVQVERGRQERALSRELTRWHRKHVSKEQRKGFR